MQPHPGESPQPSGTDEETFARVFGRCDWAVIFILARGGKCYARLRYNVGPGVDVELPVDVDYGHPFEASDWELWHDEYLANIRVPPPEPVKETKPEKQPNVRDTGFSADHWWRDAWGEYANYEDFERELIDDYRY